MKAGWTRKTIGEVAIVDWGNTSLTKSSYVQDGQFLAVSAAGGDGRIGHAEHGARIPVLSAIGAQCGRMFFPEEPFTAIKNTITFTPRQDCFDSKFLYYYLTSIQLPKRGAGQPFISKGDIQKFPILAPPLPEQRRIVAILDEAFAGLEAMRANAEKNLQNAQDLFESFLSRTFAQGGVGWFETTVGDQIALQRGFDITKEQQREGSVPVVSSGGIKSYHDAAMVKAPGVVIGRKGTLGKSFYLNEDFWPHDTTLWVKDFKGNHPLFVYYFFVSLKVHHLDSGAANPALNRNMVHPIKIVWPPKQMQPVLADSFHRLRDEAERLESLYSQKLAAIDELKQSILQKAFSGELTSSEAVAA